ncbi:winged helix-turn-helix transcriptional regulator [Tunturiibacter lichenicola]|jgi:DNA-binding HxlR family transcriptional regulator|uniref:winged helix-turn-helix transcriptional regulator n=1 Tax=Tunturiibacter lichenicola TaxID=2051959 RepID=UPI003D9B3ACE
MRDKQTEYSCAAASAIELLQGKWRIQILCVMRKGPVRLGRLGRMIPSASKKVLTENLRKLESAGLISRTDLGGQIRHVEYDLVEPVKLGTYQLLDSLAQWQTVYETVLPTQHDNGGEIP